MQDRPLSAWGGTGVQSLGLYLPLLVLVLAYFLYKRHQRRREYEVSPACMALCPQI